MRKSFRRLVFLCFAWLAIKAAAQAPLPAFSTNTVAGCSPVVVSFTDNSTGNPTAWSWNFGNGATSDLQNPSTTFFVPGTYSVTLTASNADGSNSVTKTAYITVYGNPEVAFAANDSTGCYPFPVQFTDLSKASPGTTNTSWVWDLGDGTQAKEQNPTTTYLHNGNYTVSLKVTNDQGCWSTATKRGYINIDGGINAAFDYVNSTACHTPFVVGFTNASSGTGQLSYTWDFGDGTSSTEASLAHSYASTGLFSVTLVAVSSDGCRDTLKKEALLNLQDIATGFAAPDSVCARDAVFFTNTSTANAASTLWDFGDGSISTSLSPAKSFDAPGIYTIRLMQSYAGCADSALKTLKVLPRPTASFSAGKKSDCKPPLTVSFQNTSKSAMAYRWYFGDGTTSTETAPTHTYTDYGEYAVTLVAVNAFGCTDTTTLPGYVKVEKPSIVFDDLPIRGCTPLTHKFNAFVSSPDNVVSYSWDFGNGITSTLPKPLVTFSEQGTYTVTLTVTTASGCTETASMPAAVTVGKKPTANFSATPNKVCALQEVVFNDQSDLSGAWHWSFGDGTTSDEQNPHHLYGDTGTFSVSLVVDHQGCKDTLSIKNYINIKPPIASFSYKTDCSSKLLYTFQDRSIGAKTWQWSFGDGTSSTEQNPKHAFPSYGRYTVQLTVTNDTCYHVYSTDVVIGNGTPNFTIAPAAVCQGQPVTFTADTTNAANIASYSWNFGDGSPPGYGITTTAVYPQPGIYDVTLTITDANGCTDFLVKKQAVQINGPVAGIKAANNNGCKGLQATFADDSKDDGHNKIINWQWDLGDGTVVKKEASEIISHVYAAAGSYSVSLTVNDAGGCANTLLLPSLVNTSDIKADFVSEDTVSCPGAAVRFTNASNVFTPAFSSVWNFGNGSVATEQNPSAFYETDGLYSVALKVTDANGCTDSISKPAYVSIAHPVASFTVSDSASSCIPLQVQFTNTSTYYAQHVWTLNGGTSVLPNPSQYYNQPGVYQSMLVVTSPGGCTDTAVKNITVYNPAASFVKYLPLNGCKPLSVDLKAFSPNKMSFVWDFGDGTILSNDDTVAKHTYNFFGDFVPKVIMKDSEGCVVPVTGLDTIHILGVTAKFGLNRRLFCDSGIVTFFDSTTSNIPVTAYHWAFGDGTTSSEHAPVHRFPPGVYNISLDVQTSLGCVDTFRMRAPLRVAVTPQIRIAGDSVICIGESILHKGFFDRRDSNAVQWTWKFPNGNTASAQSPTRQVYNEAGKFTVQSIASNGNGCSDTALQNIYVNPLPSVDLPSTITTQIGTPVLLPAHYSGNMQTIQWSVPDGLSCADCPQPYANPKMNTKYTVQFVDNNGCRNSGKVQVIVLCNNDNVFVPNTFSPNGDGSNDVFYVRGKGLSRVKSLRIFNRWGQAVFERVNFSVNDASAGWDGRYKGAAPVPDVYVYQVEIFCDNSQVVKFEGNVALIR